MIAESMNPMEASIWTVAYGQEFARRWARGSDREAATRAAFDCAHDAVEGWRTMVHTDPEKARALMHLKIVPDPELTDDEASAEDGEDAQA